MVVCMLDIVVGRCEAIRLFAYTGAVVTSYQAVGCHCVLLALAHEHNI